MGEISHLLIDIYLVVEMEMLAGIGVCAAEIIGSSGFASISKGALFVGLKGDVQVGEIFPHLPQCGIEQRRLIHGALGAGKIAAIAHQHLA